MKKTIRMIGFGIALMAFLLIAAGLYVNYRFDPAWARQEITRIVKEQKQRDLHLAEDPQLRFFPTPGLRLGKASLSEPRSSQEFAALDSAVISVRLLPLLSKKLVIDQLEISGLRANIVRQADGTFNFADFLTSRTQAQQPVEFDIAGIGVRGEIHFHDEASHRRWHLRQLNVRTGRIASNATGTLHISAQIDDGRNPHPFNLKADYHIDQPNHRLAIGPLSSHLYGQLPGQQTLTVDLDAGQVILLDDRIDFEKLQGRIKSELSGETLEALLQCPHLSVSRAKTGGSAISAEVRFTGKNRQAKGQLTLAAPRAQADSIAIDSIDAQWSLQQGNTRLQGKITSPAAIHLKTGLFAMPTLKGELVVEHPAMPMKKQTFPLTGDLAANPQTSSFMLNLASRFDQTSLRSSWQIVRFAPLSALFDLDIDQLDIDRYWAPENAPESPAPSPAQDQTTLPADLDLHGRAKIDRLQINRTRFNKIDAAIVLSGGKLDLRPINPPAVQGKNTAGPPAKLPGQ